jgi:hypothetical protein
MWANFEATAAADAFVRVQLQSHYVAQVLHYVFLLSLQAHQHAPDERKGCFRRHGQAHLPPHA